MFFGQRLCVETKKPAKTKGNMRRYLVSKSKPLAATRVLQEEDRTVSCSRIFEGKSSSKTKTYGRAKNRSLSPRKDSRLDSPSPSNAVALPNSVSTPTTTKAKTGAIAWSVGDRSKHSTSSMSPAAQPLTPPTSQSPRIKFPRGVCQVEGDDDDDDNSDEDTCNQCEGEEPVVDGATHRANTTQKNMKKLPDHSSLKKRQKQQQQRASIFSHPSSSRKRFFSHSTGQHGVGACLPPRKKSLRTPVLVQQRRLKKESAAATETLRDPTSSSPAAASSALGRTQKSTSTGSRGVSTFTRTGAESHKLVQATIDLGQRGAGGSVCCPRCGMWYTRGSQEDEESHRTFCASVRSQRVAVAHKHLSGGRGVRVIRCSGLKKSESKGVPGERRLAPAGNKNSAANHVVVRKGPCFVAEISAGASKYAADKLRQLHRIMAEQMGTVSDCDTLLQSSQTRHYLFLLSNGFVAGCLVAQCIHRAFVMSREPLLDDDESVEVSGPARSSRSSDAALLIKHHETSEKADVGVSQVRATVSSLTASNRQSVYPGSMMHAWSPSVLPTTAVLFAEKKKNVLCVFVGCSVEQLWVHSAYRRAGIASQLIDAARKHMIYGHTVPKCRVVRFVLVFVFFLFFFVVCFFPSATNLLSEGE